MNIEINVKSYMKKLGLLILFIGLPTLLHIGYVLYWLCFILAIFHIGYTPSIGNVVRSSADGQTGTKNINRQKTIITMLSRLALRSLQEAKPLVIAARPTSTTAVKRSEERDEVNFPRRVRPIEPGRVRLGFLPEEWFKFFYAKTGVTGPYMLGLGLGTFLFSKEIYVLEHEYYTGLTILFMVVYGVKKFGPGLAAYLDKEIDEIEGSWVNYRKGSIQSIKDTIEAEKKAQWEAEGQTVLFDAKRENVALQLEAAYRERLATVHTEVKKRLDYQLETANVKTRIEQKHMVDWIVNSVKSSITPVQESAALKQCFADLKSLAPKAA
ncbi:ATP synthase subunit b, mitochondrial [Palaemon carinicauda]|uniref:ATP synthase subunit b, mitochondrial n=1 Tax=Palaemon carinicauda TaxID=392227 RepID=UPI0035B635A0